MRISTIARALLLAAGVTTAASDVARAQPGRGPGGRAVTARGDTGGDPTGARRGERIEQLLRRRGGLSDAQVSKLRATTRRTQPERMALARQERAVADSLRLQLAAPTRDETAVADLIAGLFAVRRARLEFREREQRELATFMSPSQRAMLLGIEEQARRRVAEARATRHAPPR
jgi:hypothetical protein